MKFQHFGCDPKMAFENIINVRYTEGLIYCYTLRKFLILMYVKDRVANNGGIQSEK